MRELVAYFITFTTYGERLHGDERGSFERVRRDGLTEELEPDVVRTTREARNLLTAPVVLDSSQRACVADAIEEVCRVRSWLLFGLNVRTNHVHAVVYGETSPERMMNAFKAWATRRLRAERLRAADSKTWTRHGSTRYLWTPEELSRAVAYVVDCQGDDLGGTRRAEDISE